MENLHRITTEAQFQKWRTSFAYVIPNNVHVRLAEPSTDDVVRVDLNDLDEKLKTYDIPCKDACLRPGSSIEKYRAADFLHRSSSRLYQSKDEDRTEKATLLSGKCAPSAKL
ncbi:hypothetical protein L3X38_042812 [Prunus dulcis]|uniref:Uncharacterized protein n=1 Tax=Prunus dulcis TaxID=3755 RepID=A0AAD4UXE1_PRUDU|nr:hypothetical protein L3X38_042812 [Prunus dulcis]